MPKLPRSTSSATSSMASGTIPSRPAKPHPDRLKIMHLSPDRPLDENACETAFCALIRARARQTVSPLTVIHGRLSRRELLKLIDPWQRFAARELGIRLTVE